MENLKEILSTLDRLLLTSFSKIPKNKKIGVLFSGGIDSSQIAWYAQRQNLHPTLFTFGTEFSKDYDFAQRLSQDLKLDFVYLKLTKEEISTALKPTRKILQKKQIDDNLMQVSLSIGFFLIAGRAKEMGIDLFLSGQGSDELFGGYNKYLKLLDDKKKLEQQMAQDTKNLFLVDVIRDRAMTETSGIEIYFPYLDQPVIDYVQSLPLSLKINAQARKWLIRELGKTNGLPEYIFTRPKNALQYSSGIQKIVEKLEKTRSHKN